jgi:multidrug resistance efflux pump
MKKRIIFSIIVIFIVVVTILAIFFAQRGKRIETIQTTGIVEGIEVNLSSKISGRISEICCDEGNGLKKGQVVIRRRVDLEASSTAGKTR